MSSSLIGHRQTNNLISIDIARAIAALGVFYYHQHIGGIIAQYSGFKWFAHTDEFGSDYAVPLFFLISGYCIHLSNIKYIKTGQKLPLKLYCKRRLLRIYPAYLVSVILSIGINFITHYDEPTSKIDLIVHLFLLQGFTVKYFNTINLVLWTISIEAAFYILYPFFYYLRIKFSLNYALIVTFIVSGISIFYFSNLPQISYPLRYSILNLWFAWCCGAYLADKKCLNEGDLKSPLYKIIYGTILIASILAKLFFQPLFIIINYQLNILAWTLPLILFVNSENWLRSRKSYLLKILTLIGVSSYSLYLLHYPLIALKNFWSHKILPPSLQPIGVFIGILIIPAIAFLSYTYIEKPFMDSKKAINV